MEIYAKRGISMGAEQKIVSFAKYQAQRNLLREIRSNIKQYEEKSLNELKRLHSSAKRGQTLWARTYYIGLVGFILMQGILFILLALGYNQARFIMPTIVLSLAFIAIAFASIPNKKKH